MFLDILIFHCLKSSLKILFPIIVENNPFLYENNEFTTYPFENSSFSIYVAKVSCYFLDTTSTFLYLHLNLLQNFTKRKFNEIY